MIQIKPHIEYTSLCPYCGGRMDARDLLWQGIHVCVEMACRQCGQQLIDDLPVGHALYAPYRVDVKSGRLFGDETSESWFGQPLLSSLCNPEKKAIGFQVERFVETRRVVTINCIDFLYGHALLKLLNVQRHLNAMAGVGVIVIVQPFLRWLVPAGLAEVWTVDIGAKEAKNYYESIHESITKECERFDAIYLSRAFSHPANIDIARYSRVQPHEFSNSYFRITFIWREDRCWAEARVSYVLRRLGLKMFVLRWQNYKVQRLFRCLRSRFPQAAFTVAGLGVSTRFPTWIDDRRVSRFDEAKERDTCVVYAQSRLVIGVHGSNMLLPSGHAGLVIDLMPNDRWGNYAQDVLYGEVDPRLASFRYRYLPDSIGTRQLGMIAATMLDGYTYFQLQMTNGIPSVSKKAVAETATEAIS